MIQYVSFERSSVSLFRCISVSFLNCFSAVLTSDSDGCPLDNGGGLKNNSESRVDGGGGGGVNDISQEGEGGGLMIFLRRGRGRGVPEN